LFARGGGNLLRDFFTWAYERSCQRYLAVTQTMVDPDPLRIQYWEVLIQAVQLVVCEQNRVDSENIQQLIDELVLEKDKETFRAMLLDSQESARGQCGQVSAENLGFSVVKGHS